MKKENQTNARNAPSALQKARAIEASFHGIDYSANATNDIFGSCMIYPTENSCSSKLDIGCVITNQGLCNDINSFFEFNETGWATRWLSDICCGSNHDPSNMLDMSRLNLSNSVCQTNNVYQKDLTRAIDLIGCDVKQCPCSEFCNTLNGDCEEICDKCENNSYQKGATAGFFSVDSGLSTVGQVFVNDYTNEFFKVGYTKTRNKMSGVFCSRTSSDGCIFVEDLYEEIKKNPDCLKRTFYPYISNVYNRLNRGSIRLSNPKQHFIQMYEVGGHGINRPMTIDEIFEAHRDRTKTLRLTKNDIALMVISYEIEKSFTTENYCMCSVLNNNIFEEQSYKLVYDLIDSPVDGKRRIDILLPVASRHNVARKLGATISSPKSVYSIYQHKKLTGKSSKGRESQLISRNTLKNIEAQTLGTCHLRDGAKISANEHMCGVLNGIFTSADFNHINNTYERNQYLNNTFRYTKTSRRIARENPNVEVKIDPIFDDPQGPIIDPGNPGPCRNCINTCCPSECMDCIFDAIREAETGDPNTPGPNGRPNDPDLLLPNGETDPISLGCNGLNPNDPDPGVPKGNCQEPWTQQKKRECWACGPYQLKYDFWYDSHNYGKMPPACRALRGLDWENELCKPCSGTAAEIRACCKRKKELSILAMKCWWRRFTRNGGCQDGNGQCSGPDWLNPEGACFTCEDLVRSHNRGPCGHNNPESVKRWKDVKKIMCESGQCKGCCESTSDCGNNSHSPVPNSCCPEQIPETINPEIAIEKDGYWPLYRTIADAIAASPTPTEARNELEKAKGLIGYHEHELGGEVFYMPNGLEMERTQFHGDFEGSPMQILLEEYYSGISVNNKYKKCVDRANAERQKCLDKCITSDEDRGECNRKCWCEDSNQKHRCWKSFGGENDTKPDKEDYPGPYCNSIRRFCQLDPSDPEWNQEGCQRPTTPIETYPRISKSIDDSESRSDTTLTPRQSRSSSQSSSTRSSRGSSSGGSSSGSRSSSGGGGSSSGGGGSYGY